MGMLYVFTGTGKGKTTAALGTAVRSLGHGRKVLMVQFLKKRKSGEVSFSRKRRNLSIYQFGSHEFVNLEDPKEKDVEEMKTGLEFAEKAAKMRKPDLLILDELNVVMRYNIVRTEKVIRMLKRLPKRTDVIITGRFAPVGIMRMADLVTDMKEIKHPYQKGIMAKKGLDY